MLGKTNLTRKADHFYRIKPHERCWIYAGVTSDKRQVLMGLYCPNLVAIFFDKGGNLLDVQQRVLDFMVEDAARGIGTSIYDERIEPQLLSWQGELGFHPATIRIQKFFVLEASGNKDEKACQREGIGIQDYPAFYHDVLANPYDHTEEEREHVRNEQPQWERDGKFVLWWGNDYWFDSTGECVAS